jgi:hypothetical protein
MRTIQTSAVVSEDGTLTLHVPPDIPPGKHRVVVVIEDPTEAPAKQPRLEFGRYPFGLTSDQDAARPPLDFPVHDSGPWPSDLSTRREDLYDYRVE